jgi:hypothetical protein
VFLQDLEDVVGGAAAYGFFGVAEFVDEEAEEVVFLFGFVA